MRLFRKYKTIDDLLPGFLLEKEFGRKAKTTSGYNCHTKVFRDWLEDHGMKSIALRKITENNITQFSYFLGKERGLDKTTCEKYFLDVRAFFKYALKKGEVDKVPFDFFIYPRKKKDQGAQVIQHEDLKPLLLKIKEADPQLYLACMIQYYCFIRPGKELRLLKLENIDLYHGVITVPQELAKNGIKQTVTMPHQLIDLCIEYGMETANKSLYVFGRNKNFDIKPWSVNMLRYHFNRIRKKMGLPEDYKFYSFKHTGATALHQSGISMREIMDQLRHTNLSASQHYLKKHCGIVNDRIRDNFPSPM
jgi:integrase